jgi:hypothetical protein
MTQFLFIIGSPRSGTTFVTNYIGKYTDKKYNEPWKSHPIETPRLWKFPQVDNIVFKYCENWKNVHVLLNHYPNSLYIHIWRNPDDVVYSMAYPKPDSFPQRNLYGGHDEEDRLRLCIQRWYSNMMHCLSLYNIIPNKYVEVKYENAVAGLKQVEEKSGLKFDYDKFNFENKNIYPNLDWTVNEPAMKLRNLVQKYNGPCLSAWLNKTRPKLLQRVIL